ncbi:MAG: 50S ribosomal protein L9 [Phycisphaerae bacterium]|nr:50S ribosomal protein L9 [Phycisphaerae bacterium]
MPKTYQLLLTESVEALGIVGDVVTVRSGFARNFLLPRNLATTPSPEKIAALAAKRADAERHVAEVRKHREEMVEKLEGFEVTLERTTNDQGLLYGSITQQDLATALKVSGFTVQPRHVRITQTIKRIGDYDITVKPEADLEATVKLHVKSDRVLDLHKHDHPEAPAAPAADSPADLEDKPKGKKSKAGEDEEHPKARKAKSAEPAEPVKGKWAAPAGPAAAKEESPRPAKDKPAKKAKKGE